MKCCQRITDKACASEYDLCANVLGSVRVGQSVTRLLEVEAGRTNVSDHHRLAVTAERVFEQSSQLAVAIVHVLTAGLVAASNNIPHIYSVFR